MSDALQHRPSLTVAEFLNWEGNPDRRYELIEGEVVERRPQTLGHGMLLSRLSFLLTAAVMKTRGFAIITNGGVKGRDWGRTAYAADLVIVRVPVAPGQIFAEEPVLVAEILSETTERVDRYRKLPDYQSLASVEQVLLVDQNRPLVDLFTRAGTGGGWTAKRLAGLDGQVSLHTVGATISMAALYQGLGLGA